MRDWDLNVYLPIIWLKKIRPMQIMELAAFIRSVLLDQIKKEAYISDSYVVDGSSRSKEGWTEPPWFGRI